MARERNSYVHHPSGASYDWETKLHDLFNVYGKYLTALLVFLIIATVLLYRHNSSKSQEAQESYLKAESEFRKFKLSSSYDPSEKESAFNSLQAILKNYPELHQKYDALIAQAFLLKQLPDEAEKFANYALERTKKDNIPFYAAFTHTTMQIANKEYAQALNSSLELKQAMAASEAGSSSQHFDAALYGLNLLRISLLQAKLQETEAELQTIKEFQSLASNTNGSISAAAFAAIQLELQDGSVNLLDYFNERQKILNKK